MKRRGGPKAKVLSPRDRSRLQEFRRRISNRLGVSIGNPQLKLAMNPAPFSWRTLQRALRGFPVSLVYHDFIVAFLDRHIIPANAAPVRDQKAAASGERPDEETMPAENVVRTFIMRGQQAQAAVDAVIRRGSR